MLHENINISHQMVHAKKVEETRAKRKSRHAKRDRSYDGGFSNCRLHNQDTRRFNKTVSNQVIYKFTKARDYMVFNPKAYKGTDTRLPTKKPTCGMCGNKNYGDCLKRIHNYSGCGKSGYKVIDSKNLMGQYKGSGQDQASGSNDFPKKNHL